MNLSGKKIVVTGADGFIGSHLVEYLVAKQYDVIALVHYNSFNSWGWLDEAPESVKKNIQVVSGDIRDLASIQAAVKQADVVLHLAALIAIPYSYQAPDAYVATNVQGTLNVLQAARDADVEKVVVTSTSEVYGTAQFVPITEAHPLQAQSPYAATKIAADQLALSFHAAFALPVSIARPFNTYGPRQSARAIIPTVITQLAAGVRTLKLGSIHPTRDFNYVADTVAGLAAVAESDAALGEVINLGSHYEISIADTVALIAELMGCDVTIATEAQRVRPEHSEVERLWADNAKALQHLDWRPAYAQPAGLRQGLQQTIDWFTQAQNLQRYKTDFYNV